ncbi:hypothetical protein [Micromonospora sp. DT227]|uniref:hypothetical protein n=1 Tax=Micromonospora sp. DT227 TaxID=3393433 RepID=UPI003CEFF650
MTLEQFAAWRQADLNAEDAATAQLLIDMVSAEIRSHCGWHITPIADDTVTVDGSGSQVLALPTMRLLDVVSLKERGVDVDVAGVQWSEAGYLWRAAPWTSALRGVEVQISHGYAATPPELAAVVCGAAARAMANPSGVAREASGGESVSYATQNGAPLTLALTDLELRLLDRRYRIANPA